MKKFTILERTCCEGLEVMMVPTKDIYEVVYLQYCVDSSFILTPNGELNPTEGYYPTDYFDGSDERLVVKCEDNEKFHLNADGEILTIQDPDDPWDEDAKIDVIDVTADWMSYVAGKAVDIEHGINTTQVIFDADDDDDGWKSVEEVDADYYVDHEQDYPNQELTRIYECSNGRKIRETSPFFADYQMEVYEYID